MALHEVDWDEVSLNPSTLFGREQMALAAGSDRHGVAATAVGWGSLGTTWEGGAPRRPLPTATVYVRQSSQTRAFLDAEHRFTLSSLGGREGRRALRYLGRVSGLEDPDKIASAGLTPVFGAGTVWFREASLVLVCRKLYVAPLVEEGFADRSILRANYPERGLHLVYVGQILRVLVDDRPDVGAARSAVRRPR